MGGQGRNVAAAERLRARLLDQSVSRWARVTLPKETRVSLLDAFELRCGERLVQLPMSARRLLAFLALHQHPVYRVYAAGMLWLETRDERAVANLRSALWRLRRTGLDLVEATGEQLRLAPSASVVLRDALSYAHQLLATLRQSTSGAVPGWAALAGGR